MRSLKELMTHREVLLALVWRDLKTRYRGSVLGFLWTLLNPLLLMAIYSLVFSVYVRMDIPNYPIFVFAGLLPWTWFSSALLSASTSIVDSGGLVKRVAFPPQILPAVCVTATLVNFLLALPLLWVFVLIARLPLGWGLLAVPLLVAIQFVFTLGLAITVALLSVRFRDLHHLLSNLLTLWFFLTPLIYPVNLVPEGFRPLLRLNPLVPLIVAYQDALYRARMPTLDDVAMLAVAAVVITVLAFALCDRLRWTVVEQV